MKNTVSRAMMERIPIYLSYLKSMEETSVSSTVIAKNLCFGEVQVRKDMAMLSGAGKPRIGYVTKDLIKDIEHFLGANEPTQAVIVGAGKLGRALIGYEGFEHYGVSIAAAFDCDLKKQGSVDNGKAILSIDRLRPYCVENNIKIGIITVPAENAQSTADLMVSSGIKAIWNFAPAKLILPEDVTVINEKLAVSLSLLNQSVYKGGYSL